MNGRKYERWPCEHDCKVTFSHGSLSANITNISRGGFLGSATSPTAIPQGANARIQVDRIGSFSVTIRWVGMSEFGAEFDEPISEAVLQRFVPKLAKSA